MTSPNESAPALPSDPDVHLPVFLHGARFDFTACRTAALEFVRDHRERHYYDAVNNPRRPERATSAAQ